MPVEGRLHRTSPGRPGPRRGVIPEAEPFNGAANGGTAPPSPAVAPGAIGGSRGSADDVIRDAVGAAYGVVEENIQEGRRAAERLRGVGHAALESTPGAKVLAGRLMHMTRELGGAWVDLLMALVKEPEVRALVDRMSAQDRGKPPPAAAAPPSSSMPITLTQRVSSPKPVELTLSPLPPLAPGTAPAIAGLHALDPAHAAITRVAFARGSNGGLELAITIPADQPADTYWGTLVDLASRQPIGTLTVRVME